MTAVLSGVSVLIVIINMKIRLLVLLLLWMVTGRSKADGRAMDICEAQGKGRAKGRPRKVTQRSFIDGGWWISFPFPLH